VPLSIEDNAVFSRLNALGFYFKLGPVDRAFIYLLQFIDPAVY